MVPFAIYLITLAPSVTFFDSGEFITAIKSLGSAHSPGYPLFIDYANPFTYLPFGNIAFRVNIATAFSASIACYGVYLLVYHMLKDEDLGNAPFPAEFFKKAIAFGVALTFAFSARLWLQSNHDKPYPLVSFLGAIIFYLLLLWRERYRSGNDCPAPVYLGALLCGLAFGAHQTMVLLIPSYLVLLLAMDFRLLCRLKEMILVCIFALIGLSIHLHLPIRATQNPLLNWGDPKTLTQFIWHFLRRGYPVEKPHRGLSLFWAQLNAFNIPHEFTWIGLALLLLGLCAFIKKRRDEVFAYLTGIVFFLLVIVGYLNTPEDTIFLTEEFFTPIYLFSAVFIGLGMFSLLKTTLMAVPPEKLRTRPAQWMAFILILALPITVCALNYKENDQHKNYIAHDYAVNTMRTLPEGAILFTWGDSGAFPLWYIQGVEKLRQDLSIVHTPHLNFTWYLDTFPDLFKWSAIRESNLSGNPPEYVLGLAISEQIDKRPVYIDFSTRYSVQLKGYVLHQQGICYRLEQGAMGTQYLPDLAVWDRYSLRGIDGKMFFRDLDTSKAILIYAYARLEGGETLLHLGHQAEGIEQLLIAGGMSPELKPQIDETLGVNGSK
jgi:hypothetical protein